MNICVFCSSSEGLAQEYYDIGHEVGRLIAKGGHTLVFGGYTKGIMGAVANSVKANGGKVISVIPAVFNGVRTNFEDGADVVLAGNMSDRKDKMAALADAFIALPGGIGTFDELFQVMVLNDVGEANKPVAVLMQGPTMKMLGRLISEAEAEGFVTRERLHRIGFCNSAVEVMDYIEGA